MENDNCIVTGCTPSHIPGVIALYNSLLKHTDMEFDFYVLCDGDPVKFRELKIENIKCEFGVELEYNPGGSGWGDGKTQNPSMYSRICIPDHFKQYKRAIWLDSDTIVLDNISTLFKMDMEGYPVAMSLNGNPWNREKQTLRRDMEVWNYDYDISDVDSPQAGVMLFDIDKWHEWELTEKFVYATKDENIKGKYVVQSYLGYILMGQFKVLPFEWNVDVSWLDMAQERRMLGNPHILHYIGGGKKVPWNLNGHNYIFYGKDYTELWLQYYNKGELN